MNAGTRVHICQKPKDLPYSIHQRLAELCLEQAPQLAWAEPMPRLRRKQGAWLEGRDGRFQSLVAGVPEWPEDLCLSEARLFWADRAVHLLATGTGCASVTLTELAAPADSPNKVLRIEQPLLCLGDWDRGRLGLEGLKTSLPDGLTAIEYRDRGRVLAWRMVLRG